MSEIGMIREKLHNIAEPTGLKKHFRDMLAKEEKIAIATIKQGWWLAKIVYNNKDLWKKLGVRWPDLVKAAASIYVYSIAWIKDKISWRELIDKLIDTALTIKKIRWGQ